LLLRKSNLLLLQLLPFLLEPLLRLLLLESLLRLLLLDLLLLLHLVTASVGSDGGDGGGGNVGNLSLGGGTHLLFACSC
jgi:hypothetical protein